MPSLCRDCLHQFESETRCPKCRSPRVLSHPELFNLSIAHMDCDAFYASVEKRDNPDLRDKPVIIGGGRRGVVSTACYVARIQGVHSAMPMFQALKKCPDAVVIKPRMSAYAEASGQIRRMMEDLTPSIEPLSMDEAFIDLTGTERLHGTPPAVTLAGLVKRMEDELGLSGSIGLSHNKFLAKLASDLDKPRGFSVIGKAETLDRLAPLPIKKIWGAGKVMQAKLEGDGVRTFADLRRWDRDDLIARYGSMGLRLYHLSRGEDRRSVSRNAPVKSISKETTFGDDQWDVDKLRGYLWRLAEQVSDRAKAKGFAGMTVTLKAKRADFRSLTRNHTLYEPTQIAERIYKTAEPMLADVMSEAPFRLIGVGISHLYPAEDGDQNTDMLELDMRRKTDAERATDKIREKFGTDAIIKGRSLR
ncbi:MAG: DNA polymerase IV [Pseudomonadota bacterium]